MCDGYEVPKTWFFEPRRPDSQEAVKTEDKSEDEAWDLIPTTECQISQQALSKIKTQVSLPTRIDLIIPIKDSEGLLLVQSYIKACSSCPVAWDSETYIDTSHSSDMTSMDVLRLHHDNPVTRMAHLAMATATLHLFQPNMFPSQLQFKYLQLAIAEVRARILKRNFQINDLLHGISQIFLATVLIGDVTAARAHLRAAKDLVIEQGGFDAIWPTTARSLKYGDFHLAVETISPPAFGALPVPPLRYVTEDFSALDPVLTRLANEIRYSALNESRLLSDRLVQCLCTFVESAVALANIWTDISFTSDLEKLNMISGNVVSVHNTLLDLSGPQRLLLTTLQEDTLHTLVLWVLLFCFLANSTVVSVKVWDNTVEISNEVLLHPVSDSVRRGLKEWNGLISTARKNNRAQEGQGDEDLVKLTSVVSNMEAEQSVRLGPLMSRLVELRRTSLTPDKSPGDLREGFTDWLK